MKYNQIVEATFVSRPNRFIAKVILDGETQETTVHVKNTGRCKELLVPGCRVYLSVSDNPQRKTKYDLVAVIKQHALKEDRDVLINMDSQAPNAAATEYLKSNRKLFPEITFFKSEYTYGDSRFDFYVEYLDDCKVPRKMFVEVKGCTLEDKGHALFPDAPTLRGLKHVTELTQIKKSGYAECTVLIIIQMKGCTDFSANRNTQPAFADALKEAADNGVRVVAVDCKVNSDTMVTDAEVPVIF